MRENSQVPVAGPRQGDPRLTLGLAVAVLSGRHPGHTPFERLDLEALAGEVLLIKDPFHFAIDSGLLCVVATAVVDDLEDFEGEVFRLTLARESARAAPQSDATSISRRASDGKGRPKHKYCARPTAELSITPLPSPFAAQGHVRVPGLHRFLQRGLPSGPPKRPGGKPPASGHGGSEIRNNWVRAAEVPALDRLRGRSAAAADRQALQARAARPLLEGC
jgi:hypothetical protein